MKLKLGNLVTIENPKNGRPYKNYYGLLTNIRDIENKNSKSEISDTDPNFIFCQCTIDWYVPPLPPPYFNSTEIYNATYVREYNNA